MDANDLLMSGGIKSIGWKENPVGYTVVGTITDSPKVEQMKKFQSEELDFWPSGDPKMQIVLTIQTDMRDPENPHDDGKRRLHIPPRMMTPVREAVQKAGAKGLEIGGRIAVRRIGGTGATGDPFTFASEYAAPAVDPGSLLAGNPAATAPAAQAAPMLPQQAPAPAQAQAAPAMSATLASMAAQPAQAAVAAPASVDPGVWAALAPAQQQAVLAALNAQNAGGPGF